MYENLIKVKVICPTCKKIREIVIDRDVIWNFPFDHEKKAFQYDSECPSCFLEFSSTCRI